MKIGAPFPLVIRHDLFSRIAFRPRDQQQAVVHSRLSCRRSGLRVPAVAVAFFLLPPIAALAQSGVGGSADGTPRPSAGLQTWDWLVIAIYMLGVLGIGWYFSRQQTDEKEYFIAGKRHVSPILTGISLFATLMSTISYLGKPGEVINKGPFLLIAQFIAAPIAFFIVGWWVVPKLMRVRVTSAFELLESRLGSSVRLLGSLMFVSLRLIWMATVIYLSSIALVVTLGVSPSYTFLITAAAAVIAIIYASMGGLRTVIITDLIQFSLLFLGAATTIVIVTLSIGDFSWIPRGWSPSWDHQEWFSWDPTVRVTVFNATLAIVVWRVATASSDQTAVQRYMAVKDIAAARRSYLVTESSALIITAVLGLLGFALLGFFTRFPEAMREGMTIKQNADVLFPLFVGNYLPVGLTGLVVCGLLAAATSSVDSGVNAISAVVTKDILPRLNISPKTDRQQVHLARLMSFSIGVSIIVLSYFVQFVPGNFLEIVNRSGNLFVQPIFCLFLLAIWIPFATPLGAWMGFISGLGIAILVSFWSNITGRMGISYHWIGPCALVADLSVSLAVSYWGPRRENLRGSRTFGLIFGALIVTAFVGIAVWGRSRS